MAVVSSLCASAAFDSLFAISFGICGLLSRAFTCAIMASLAFLKAARRADRVSIAFRATAGVGAAGTGFGALVVAPDPHPWKFGKGLCLVGLLSRPLPPVEPAG